MEVASGNIPAPLVELLDNFMEQMERLTEDVGGMKEGIQALVAEMRKLVGVAKRWTEKDKKMMEYREEYEKKEEEEKKDKWMETDQELEEKEEEEKEKDK